ncbi:MAG: UDP-N-acetylmuramate--L-alanine ligase [Ruminococcaceae bacterium]|nr:UDP-N-acetylmuramate--L-alanine ligase [Oscillospiraceae bacterium]
MNHTEWESCMKQATRIHFVGIGGISMSSLAAITKERGYEVSGSDRTPSALTERLASMGIAVRYAHEAENVQGASLVVYTAAVHSDNPELAEAARCGIPLCTRAEYLGWLMRGYRERIGVAGTHGKSTVTSMLSEIYLAGDLDPTVVSGAELRELGGAYRLGGETYFLFEACEYCDSFLSFCPTTAVITNLEYDHADYFKDMDQLRASFSSYTALASRAVLNADDAETMALAKTFLGKVVTYGKSAAADYRAESIVFDSGCASFDLIHQGQVLCRIALRVPGDHNISNALAAAAASLSCGATPRAVAEGLAAFTGAARRFDYVGKMPCGADVYNDYAHHPSEIRATLSAAKGFGRRVLCVFQPHTYSRTAALLDAFSASFAEADLTLFADIYAAREVNTFGISSETLAKQTPNSRYLGTLDAIASFLRAYAEPDDLILILGAGDVIRIDSLLVDNDAVSRA